MGLLTAVVTGVKAAAGAVVSAVKTVAATVVATATTSPGLADVVTAEMLSGVFDEVVALLPVCIPVMIGFIALRKGISFVQGILHSA